MPSFIGTIKRLWELKSMKSGFNCFYVGSRRDILPPTEKKEGAFLWHRVCILWLFHGKEEDYCALKYTLACEFIGHCFLFLNPSLLASERRCREKAKDVEQFAYKKLLCSIFYYLQQGFHYFPIRYLLLANEKQRDVACNSFWEQEKERVVQPAKTTPNPKRRWIEAERWMAENHLQGLIVIS